MLQRLTYSSLCPDPPGDSSYGSLDEMAEVIERMAVVETKIEAIHETLTNVEAKLSATLEGQNRMNVYEKIGQGLFKTLQALAAALLGAWAAIHFGGK